VNAIIDACYKSASSKKWEAVKIDDWRGRTGNVSNDTFVSYDAEHFLIKKERMPDGRTKVMLKNKQSGEIIQKYLMD
jgi:hypothetical protein